MIRHIVLLDLDDTVSSASVAALVDALEDLPHQIDVIERYDVGRDCGFADDNAAVSVVAEFADATSYAVYRDHPRHRAVIAEHIRPVLRRRLATQVEI